MLLEFMANQLGNNLLKIYSDLLDMCLYMFYYIADELMDIPSIYIRLFYGVIILKFIAN